MASNDDFDLDDFDLDNFSFEEFDTFGEPEKDDRKPITKAASAFTKKTRDTLKSPSYYKTLLRKSLPKHYREALDLGDEISAQGAELYNSAADRASPAIREIKRRSKSFMPTAKKYLPKKLADRLEKALEPEEEYQAYSEARQREDQIALMLGDVFSHQLTEGAKSKEEERNRADFTEAVNNKRHQQSIESTEAIRTGIARLVGFQDNITVKYQQKSLELQYRQLFATRDIVSESQRQTRETNELLKDIVKNSGLPDAIKLRRTEHAGYMTRERFIARGIDKLEGSVSAVASRVGRNLTSMVREKVGTWADRVEQASQMSENFGGLGSDPASMAGEFGSGAATSTISDLVAERLGRFIGQNRRLRLSNARVGTALANAPSAVRDYADFDPSVYSSMENRKWHQQNTDLYDNQGRRNSLWKRAIGGFHNIARGLLRGGGDVDDLSVADMSAQMGAPAEFSKRVSHSITDIIPGLLARQLRELTRLRTGEDAPLLTYNYDRGRFITSDRQQDSIVGRVGKRLNATSINRQVDEVFKGIDPSKTLSAEARSGLKRQLLLDARQGRGFHTDRLANANYYDEKIPAEVVRELTQHFEVVEANRSGGNLAANNRVLKSTQSYQALMSAIPDVLDELELQVQLGNRQALEKLGLMTYANGQSRFNYEAIIDMIAKDSEENTGPHYRFRGRGSSRGPFSYGQVYRRNVGLRERGQQAVDGLKARIKSATNRVTSSDTVSTLSGKVDDYRKQAINKAREYDVEGRLKGAKDRVSSVMSNSAKELRQRGTELGHILTDGYHNVKGEGKRVYTELVSRINRLLSDGDYRDAVTGAAIKRVEDIKNDVVDSGGNIILEARVIADQLKAQAEPHIAQAAQTFRGANQRVSETMSSVTQRSSTPDALSVPNNQITSLVEQLVEIQTGAFAEITTISGLLQAGLSISEGGDGSGVKATIMQRVKGNRFLRSLGGVISGGLTAGGSVLRGFGSIIGASASAGASVIGGGGRFVGAGLGLGGRLLGGMFGTPRDIVVTGERYPVLFAKNIKKGIYQDVTTGKIIKGLSDIKGPVADLSDEGNLVITAEDYAKGLNDVRGKSLIRAGATWLGKFYGAMFNPLVTAARLTNRAMWGIANAITKPKDVYTKDDMTTPRLYAKVMQQGGYVSQVSGKVIKSAADIDGPVMDMDGRIVLSLENLDAGIVDWQGRPIRSLGDRVVGLAKNTIGLGVSAVKTTLKASWGLLKGTFGVGKRVTKSLFKRVGMAFGMKFDSYDEMTATMSHQSVGILESIYQLLDDRLPGGRRRFGDTNNDGMRDNSWRDIIRQRKEKAEADKLARAEAGGQRGDGLFGKLGGMLSGLFGRGGDEESDDGDTYIGGDFSKDSDKDDKKRKSRKPKGRLGRFGSKIGNLAKRVPGAGAVGTAAKWGFNLLRGAAAVTGLSALAGGIGSVGGAVLGGLGTVAAGAASILASPVVLTGLAIGAVGYLAYRYFSRDRSAEMRKIRILQYGISPDNEDSVKKVLYLEDKLSRFVNLSDGQGRIDIDARNLKEIMTGVGLGENDEEAIQRFLSWFQGRFKPVYLTHRAAVESIKPGADLLDADTDFSASQKLTMLTKIGFPPNQEGSPYSVMISPFTGGIRDVVSISAILNAFEEAKSKFTADAAKESSDPKAKPGASTERMREALATTAALPITAPDNARPTNRGTQSGGTNSYEVMTSQGMMTVEIKGRLITRERAQSNEALDHIRLKAYGLVALDIDKVEALMTLEEGMEKHLTFDNARRAVLSVDAQVLAREYGAMFGLSPGDHYHEANWIAWFTKRFAPVYTEYCTAIRQFSDGGNIGEGVKRLSGQQLLTVANSTIIAMTSSKGMSVWAVTESPWKRYILNADAESTQGNINVLKRNVKKQQLMDNVSSAESKSQTPASFSGVLRKPTGVDKPRSSVYNLDMASLMTPPKSSPKSSSSYKGAMTNTFSKGSYIMPAEGRISSDYGPRIHPIKGNQSKHSGIDIAAPQGTPVLAAADGVIIRREYSNSYGNVIYIKHPDGNVSRYAHLHEFQPGHSVGMSVAQGDVIGYVGNTGASAGNHLHFEVRKGPTNSDPLIDPMTLLDGSRASDMKKELIASKKSMEGEVNADPEDPLEGVDTIASTTLKTSLKDQAPELTDPKSRDEPGAGNKATQGKLTAFVDAMPRGLGKLSPVDISRSDSLKESMSNYDEQVSGIKANRAARTAQVEQRNINASNYLNTSVNAMSAILEKSLLVQRSMDNKLGDVHKVLLDISNKSQSSNTTTAGRNTAPSGRRPVEVAVKQNNVDMRKTL